jgi:peptidoglycan/xylan/chitin deacetylase (PgdA/CDA1 family)
VAVPDGDTMVLCYYAISERWPSDEMAVSPANLRRQLKLLMERGYRGVTFGEAVRGAAGKLVAISFDDAFISVLENARPILDRLGVPGTVFVPTDFPDRDAPMPWPGIDEWARGPTGTSFGRSPGTALGHWRARAGRSVRTPRPTPI